MIGRAQVDATTRSQRMPVFEITSIKSGVVLGLYEADDAQGARNAMARGAGFSDEAHSTAVSGADASDFQVTASRSRLSEPLIRWSRSAARPRGGPFLD
jgi:hypothetical protein